MANVRAHLCFRLGAQSRFRVKAPLHMARNAHKCRIVKRANTTHRHKDDHMHVVGRTTVERNMRAPPAPKCST